MNVEFNEAGFLKNPDDWSEDLMFEIADREGITLNEEMVIYICSARDEFENNQTVPTLRAFSKMHGGDRKGTKLNQLFNGAPMKKIAMLGGLPQPTGCV
jgi:tRNA 2-thiouridine synthesizing protein E